MKTAEISPPNPIVADSPVNFKMAKFVARIIRITLSHLVAEQAGRDLRCGEFADVSSFRSAIKPVYLLPRNSHLGTV